MKNAGTKEIIIKAFLRLNAEKHEGKLRLLDILDEAGVSTTAFYHCFKSKHELILAVIEYLFSLECEEGCSEPVKTVLLEMLKVADREKQLIDELMTGGKYHNCLLVTMKDSFLRAIALEIKQSGETEEENSEFCTRLAQLYAFFFTFLIIRKVRRKLDAGNFRSYQADAAAIKEIMLMKDIEYFLDHPFAYYLKGFTVPEKKSTKGRLITALEELAEIRDFDSIDVADICEQAGVSRASFYRHFFNKLDLRNNALLVSVYRYTSGETDAFSKSLMENLYGNPLIYRGEDDIFYFINSMFQPDIESGISKLPQKKRIPEYLPECLSYAITYFLFDQAKNVSHAETVQKLSFSRFTEIVWTY